LTEFLMDFVARRKICWYSTIFSWKL